MTDDGAVLDLDLLLGSLDLVQDAIGLSGDGAAAVDRVGPHDDELLGGGTAAVGKLLVALVWVGVLV